MPFELREIDESHDRCKSFHHLPIHSLLTSDDSDETALYIAILVSCVLAKTRETDIEVAITNALLQSCISTVDFPVPEDDPPPAQNMIPKKEMPLVQRVRHDEVCRIWLNSRSSQNGCVTMFIPNVLAIKVYFPTFDAVLHRVRNVDLMCCRVSAPFRGLFGFTGPQVMKSCRRERRQICSDADNEVLLRSISICGKQNGSHLIAKFPRRPT